MSGGYEGPSFDIEAALQTAAEEAGETSPSDDPTDIGAGDGVGSGVEPSIIIAGGQAPPPEWVMGNYALEMNRRRRSRRVGAIVVPVVTFLTATGIGYGVGTVVDAMLSHEVSSNGTGDVKKTNHELKPEVISPVSLPVESEAPEQAATSPSPETSDAPELPLSERKFRVLTVNVLGAGHTDKPGQSGRDSGVRMKELMDKVKSLDTLPDAVFMQEVHRQQHDKLMQFIPKGYAVYPTSAEYTKETGHASINSLAISTDRYEVSETGYFKFRYYSGNNKTMWVVAKDKNTGGNTLFMNIHTPSPSAYGSPQDNAEKRALNAEDELAFINEMSAKYGGALTIVAGGDMNSSCSVRPGAHETQSKLPARILTKSGNYAIAEFAAEGEDSCDTGSKIETGIDWLLVDLNTKVVKVGPFKTGWASDHDGDFVTMYGN